MKRLSLESSVEIAGALPREEALARVRQHWIFAQQSVTGPDGDQEGFPVAIAEACALALPVVATRHSGIQEQIIDGETGFLVAEHDYEAMAEKCLHLLQDSEKCEEMGARAKEHITRICPPGSRANAVSKIIKESMVIPPES